MNTKKTVFFTGASGSMGLATLKEFLTRTDHFNVRILVRPSKKNKKLMRKYRATPGLEIIWGDMLDKALIFECVRGTDYVLHMGAIISPEADKYPELTMRTNLGSILNIIDAIKAQPNADDITLVYVGTIANTGCRREPIHWGRCGDPIKGAIFDSYATSKIASERAVFESGLARWVSLRQTGMLPVHTSARHEPIIFHQNANNAIEWATAEESAVLMANVCEDWIPESFWRKAYNIGGGKQWRFTHWEFMQKALQSINVDFHGAFDCRDLALYNFHGQWFTDSDALDEITHFRSLSPDSYFEDIFKLYTRLYAIPILRVFIPSAKQLYKQNKKICKKHMGPDWMIENNKEDWIKAFYGSREKQACIRAWDEGYELKRPSEDPSYLDHGYDETKPTEKLKLEDMKQAADFRGGTCTSAKMTQGDLFTPLNWTCAFGHEFEATPNLVLKGGHWCPECERKAWNYTEIAGVNPFFAQVWTPLHHDEEPINVPKDVCDLLVLEEREN
ncbi:MAG: NAD-dependent epimerase/dehydratase family protein [Clostridia bacterium]|nr:NAD-dependent epimerase/dehydratase family protein [Clostridia bacterium]